MRLLDGFFRANPEEELLYTTPGSRTILLTPGSYKVTLHGAGGAGGSSGTNDSGGTGGVGGCGGVEKRNVQYYKRSNSTHCIKHKGNVMPLYDIRE